jgi:hypothetical protein
MRLLESSDTAGGVTLWLLPLLLPVMLFAESVCIVLSGSLMPGKGAEADGAKALMLYFGSCQWVTLTLSYITPANDLTVPLLP